MDFNVHMGSDVVGAIPAPMARSAFILAKASVGLKVKACITFLWSRLVNYVLFLTLPYRPCTTCLGARMAMCFAFDMSKFFFYMSAYSGRACKIINSLLL